VAREQARIDAILTRPADDDAHEIRRAMETTMTDEVGLFRDEAGLIRAVETLGSLLVRAERLGTHNKRSDANPELVLALRLPKMLKLALVAAQGALARRESRGAHSRADYPARNDREWLCRTLVSWPDAAGPCFEYEPIAVDTMELPPGFRGYGERNIIDHPDTAERIAEVAAIRASVSAPDRHATQAALLPFHALLPECYRGPNARLPERTS
jgi:fumarate reductase flavoprotein subunit